MIWIKHKRHRILWAGVGYSRNHKCWDLGNHMLDLAVSWRSTSIVKLGEMERQVTACCHLRHLSPVWPGQVVWDFRRGESCREQTEGGRSRSSKDGQREEEQMPRGRLGSDSFRTQLLPQLSEKAPRGQGNTSSFLLLAGHLKAECHVSPTLHSAPRATGSASFLWVARLVAPSSACLSKGLGEDHSSRQHHFSPPAITEKAIGCRTATEAKEPLLQNREGKIKQATSLSCGVSLPISGISPCTQLQGRELC